MSSAAEILNYLGKPHLSEAEQKPDAKTEFANAGYLSMIIASVGKMRIDIHAALEFGYLKKAPANPAAVIRWSPITDPIDKSISSKIIRIILFPTYLHLEYPHQVESSDDEPLVQWKTSLIPRDSADESNLSNEIFLAKLNAYVRIKVNSEFVGRPGLGVE